MRSMASLYLTQVNNRNNFGSNSNCYCVSQNLYFLPILMQCFQFVNVAKKYRNKRFDKQCNSKTWVLLNLLKAAKCQKQFSFHFDETNKKNWQYLLFFQGFFLGFLQDGREMKIDFEIVKSIFFLQLNQVPTYKLFRHMNPKCSIINTF